MKKIHLLRHFESSVSELGVFHSSDDASLSSNGRVEALKAAGNLPREINRTICSPYRRTMETADLLETEYETDTRLREWDLGTLEGRDSKFFRLQNPGWNLFVDGPFFQDGESVSDVTERAQSFREDISRSNTDGDLLIITHGQFGKVLMSELTGIQLSAMQSFRFAAGSIITLVSNQKRYDVAKFGIPLS